MRTCSKCKQHVPEGSLICPHCGRKMSVVPFGVTRLVNDSSQAGEIIELPPSQGWVVPGLLVRLPDDFYPLLVPDRPQITLGRYDMESKTMPDVDLTALRGRELGVSRLHARIDCTTSPPTLTDLESQNGTEVNGMQLQPYEAYPIYHNDVIGLGKLILYVHL
jgi:hypothetical protein